MNLRRYAWSALVFASLTVASTDAAAVPKVGAPRPDVQLVDAWDRAAELKRFAGMPLLVVYEDKDSATLNQPLKDELAKLAKGDRYKKLVALVAVADVTGYDYWPVRGFVKDAIRSESHKQGTLIYCDWDGRVRTTLGLDRGTSNVVLFGRDGKVAFSHSGKLSTAQVQALVAMLRGMVDGR